MEFAYNNKIHVATCWTPFELDASQHPCLGVEPMRVSTIEAADNFTQGMSQMKDEVKAERPELF